MPDKDVESKPSQTALFAALRRALAHKEFNNEQFGPDNLATALLPPHFRFFLKFKKIQANTKEKLDALLPGLTEYMIARTAYFDRQFKNALQDQFPQIVLMGAGYDTRAYRYADLNQGTRIFELDIAPTQEYKKECLRKARIDIPHQVSFVPINFNRDSLGSVLEQAGFQPDLKTLFLWEGVSYYLDPGSVDATLEFVSKAADGSMLAFDYTLSILDEEVANHYGVNEFAQSMKEHHSGEELLFSIDRSEIKVYLKKKGLKLIEHLDNQQIEKEYLTRQDGSLLGQMTGHFCFVTASPGK
ncbi:class I SAM-dependent methyltransferase [Chloroflexota bacterium]